MPDSVYDAIVIGAGHAGLSISYFLKWHGIRHLVFERGRIGETWRSQRWDSFAFNSNNKINALPGDPYRGDYPEGFYTTSEFLQSLEAYALKFQLPVQEYATVIAVEKPDRQSFYVTVSQHDHVVGYKSDQVVVASGCQNVPKVPAFARDLSGDILQHHASAYRSPAQLPDGAILVVGSAQSGCQIAEDLIAAGRNVYLSTSMVPRCPRRYRGRDILDWFIEMKYYDVKTDDVTDPAMLEMKAPQVSGVGEYGHTLSLQSLARMGAIILGKMTHASGDYVFFQDNADQHIRYADECSQKVKESIEVFIRENAIDAPHADVDQADLPDPSASCVSSLTMLHLPDYTIKSVIWATGFDGNFGYLKLPALADNGMPKHRNGLSDIPGLYYIGFPWLRTRKSGVVLGIEDDAQFLAEKILNYKHSK